MNNFIFIDYFLSIYTCTLFIGEGKKSVNGPRPYVGVCTLTVENYR
jgi:hypothetical protein